MRFFRLAAVLLAIPTLLTPVLASSATNGARERMSEHMSQFDRHAGEPVSSFHFFRLDTFEVLGRNAIAVWTRPNQAFLLTVDEPCFGLEFATAVGVSSNGNRVYRRSDDVVFKDQRCAIAEIRPVDVKALKAERRTGYIAPVEVQSVEGSVD
jgi:hypothetical protein